MFFSRLSDLRGWKKLSGVMIKSQTSSDRCVTRRNWNIADASMGGIRTSLVPVEYVDINPTEVEQKSVQL